MKKYKPNFEFNFSKSIRFIPDIRINLLDYDTDYDLVITFPGFNFYWMGINFKINIGTEYEWTKYMIQKNDLED